jgi:glycolate dehydrogenase FAD-binding subunit
VAVVVAPCAPEALESVLNRVLPKTATRPTVLSLANAPAAAQLGQQTSGYSLVVGFEEKAATVDWQVGALTKELPAEFARSSSEFRGDVAAGLVRRVSDFPLTNPRGLTFKANLLPAGTAAFFRRADGLDPRPALVAHAGNGILYGHLPGDLGAERAKEILDGLDRVAAEWAGNVVVIRCPHEWKAVVPVWGRPTPDRELMRAVKDKMDPGRVFNPGRFVDGI